LLTFMVDFTACSEIDGESCQDSNPGNNSAFGRECKRESMTLSGK
jgi:hypothetical protein